MTEITDAEREGMRAVHRTSMSLSPVLPGACVTCGCAYPCPAVRALDRLEEAEMLLERAKPLVAATKLWQDIIEFLAQSKEAHDGPR